MYINYNKKNKIKYENNIKLNYNIMKDKSINTPVDNIRKNQKQQKNDNNKQKNQNIIINKVNTNISNENNNINNNTNKKIFKDSRNKLSNENININNNKKNKNFEKIYNNIQKYSNINKVNKRIFNSRDKILKDNTIFNKGKSKNEFITNNIKQKRNFYFNDKDDNGNNNNSNNNNRYNKNNKIKNIIYKKNNNILNNKIKYQKENEKDDDIIIEELIAFLSSDTEEINYSKNLDNIKIETNSENSSKIDEKEIISNTITIKDELINYDSDEETKIDNNLLKDSNNFNNELALILDKHLTQINFKRNYKDNSPKKRISSQSPVQKQVVHDKKSQMMSLNLNTINQIKEYPFQNININNSKDVPVNSAKLNKINKNIIRKNHHITKNKKELMLINYLKQNFFSKKEENNSNNKNTKNKNVIHRSKNDINNYEFNEENITDKKNYNLNIKNINIEKNMKIKKNKNNVNNFYDNDEELKLNIDYNNEEENKRIKYKEYKIKNNSITNGLSYLENEEEYNYDKKNINKNNDKSKKYLNHTLNNKINNNKANNLNENKYKKYIKNENFGNMDSIKNKNENNNKIGMSLENEKNYDKNNLCRNNSQNNDIIKKDSLNSIDIIDIDSNNNDKIENGNNNNIDRVKVNDFHVNNLKVNKNNINKEKKDSNIKIESIEISNNKFRKNIPSPQHKNKEKANLTKKQKNSPSGNSNNNNSKLKSSNNLFITTNNNNANNIENIQIINIDDKERTKSNSNNFVECMINKNTNNFALTCQEKSITEFINKDIQNINKFSSKKNIKCINKNINPQKYKGSYKIKQKKSMVNENNTINNTNNNNPSTSISNNNNISEIYLEDNLKTNNKSPKLSKNSINLNNSANKLIISNKNKRNIHNVNYNNEEIVNNNSLNNYINGNSYSTADKNSFIHITNNNVTKIKNKIGNKNNNTNNNINNQKEANQNNMIHPKKLFPYSNNNKNMIGNNKNSINMKKDSSNNNSISKINSSNSNKNIYNDINSSNNISNLSKNINSDKKVNIYLYNNNDKNNNKKINENIGLNNSPEIIKKSSTTMENKNNQNNNININQNNNRNSINGNQLVFHPVSNNNGNNTNNVRNHIYNIKKLENKKLSNKISNKVLKKNNCNTTKNNSNNNKINNATNGGAANNNNKLEDTFMDGQIPTVADENPNVNSLKIMKYNKCAYTNQIISQKLTKIISIKKIRNSIFSFLKGNDLYNLSLLNKCFNDSTTSAIHNIIIKKIINNKEKTIKNIWNEILKKSMLYNNNQNNYDIFLNYLNSSNKYDEEITKDLLRTLPNNDLFKKDSSNYKKLFNVLKAYSNYNKKIGYAQGMNFIVAKLIIFFNSEKESFLNLDAIFSKLNFSEVVGISNGLEQKMYIIQFLLQKFCPKIIKFLEEKKINHEIFTASWIITLFSKNFENNKLLFIIWNFSIIFGWKFIYLFTISIIHIFQKKYINLELYEFTQFMKTIFKSDDFEKEFKTIIVKTFDYMKQWKKINKELEKSLEVYKMKTDTESGTEIIIDSFDEDTIIQ